MDVHLALEAGAEDVSSQKSSGVRFFDRALQYVLHVKELAADVDVGHFRADGVARDRAAFRGAGAGFRSMAG